MFVILCIACNDSFFANWAQKSNILEVLQCFFRITGVQHKLLILMKFPNRFHWKLAKKHKVDVVFGAKFGQNCVHYCEKKKKEKRKKLAF